MTKGRWKAAAAVGFAVLTAGVLTTGYDHHVQAEVRERVAEELEAVARLEVQQIVRWIEERTADAKAYAASPTIAAEARAHAAALPPGVVQWLDRSAAVYGYRSVAILTSDGAVLHCTGAAPTARTHRAAAAAIEAGRPVVVDELSGGTVSLLAAAPVAGAPGAAIVLSTEVEHQLIRVIETWPTAAHTAELQLVRRDAADAVILSRARDGREGVPGQRVPATDATRAAAKAVSGERGLLRGRDYRGAEVLAVAQPVPGLPWHVLAKIDEAEALGPAVRMARFLHAGVASLGALCAALIALGVKARRAGHLRRLWEVERERARAEREARRAAEHYQRVVEAVDDAVVSIDARGSVTGWNRGAEATYGWRAEEALGRSWKELVGSDQDGIAPPEGPGATAGAFDRIERQRRKDGVVMYVEARVVPLREERDGIVGHVAVARDVTQRHEAEEALRISEQRLQQVVETTGAGIWDVDVAAGTVYVSAAWNRMLGHPPGARWDVRRANELVHPDDRRALVADFEAHCRGDRGVHEGEVRMRAADGSWRWVHVHGRVVARDASGSPLRMVGANVDVTERRELQARLLIADRMSSMGMLAAGVAHEINNPLSYVLSNVAWARDVAARTGCTTPCVPPDEIRTALAEAYEGAERVRDIVRDLRALSSTRDDEPVGPVDLQGVVSSALQMARSHVKHRARIESELGDVPPVAGTPSRLGQVVLNLLVNAAQAIEAGAADTNVIRVRVGEGPDGRVAVEISDTGRGIPPDVLPRIFDPFFTTKDVGEGTGLGLSIAHAIVTGLGGEIRVDSTVGRGSTFTVLLHPFAAPPAVEPAPGPGATAARRARVLVVDDEPHVALAIRRMLAPVHDVTTVANARAALEHVARAPFDAILSDVLMPEMTGLEFRRALAALSPALAARMIFMTGGAFTPETAEALTGCGNARIEKPFDREQLLGAVARALA